MQPIVISEDEFELVTGLCEKVTNEKTEFLHHVCHRQLIATSAVLTTHPCRVLSRAHLSCPFQITMILFQTS